MSKNISSFENLIIIRVIKFSIILFKKFPRLFISNVALSIFLTFIDGLSIFSIAPIVAMIQGDQTNDEITTYVFSIFEKIGLPVSLEFFLIFFVVLSISRVIMRACIQSYIIKTKYFVNRVIVNEVANKVLDASMNFVKSQRQGEFVNSMFLELGKVSEGFTSLARLISPLIQILVLIAIPLYISWKVSLVSIGVVIALSLPLAFLNKYVYKFGRQHSLASNEYTVVLQETFSQLRLISGFGNKKVTLKRINSVLSDKIRASTYLEILRIIIQSSYGPIGVITVLVTYIIGRESGVSNPEIILMVYAFYRLASSASEFAGYKNTLLSVYPAYENVMSIATKAFDSKIISGTLPFDRLNTEIKLENVDFYYSNDNDGSFHALKNINILIPMGKVVALVGPSGSGKSTLVDIIMGLQLADNGKILFDGQSISDINHEELHKKIGYVPQSNALFHDSIKSNLLWGNSKASDEDIVNCCKLANAHDFILELDNQYETIVGDKGEKLSGGQVQRIALARALIRNPEILILDEATSSLDSSSEKQIQLALEDISKKTTVIVIAHRLSTITNADYIYVLDHGEIIEEGTFEKLINANGNFSKLVNLQQL